MAGNRKRTVSSSSNSNCSQNELIRTASNFTVPQLAALIQAEHNYCRPLPCEKKTRSFPARLLFQNLEELIDVQESKSKHDVFNGTKSNTKKTTKSKSRYTSGGSTITIDENEVDVTSVDNDPPIPYDPIKARNLMEECEKHVNFARLSDVPEDWEERIVRTGWTKSQRKLFKKALKILHTNHLARLTYIGNSAEPLFRRLSIDKTARAFRVLLTEFNWDAKLSQWLHGTLVDNLSLNYLSAYLDILQTLKAKIPTLIDRMIVLSTTKGGVGRQGDGQKFVPGLSLEDKDQVNVEALNLLLKRQWDPFAPIIQQNKYKKLPVSPIFVVVPSGPPNSNIICAHRQKNLLSLLSGLGKVVSVTLNSSSANKLNLDSYCERMLNTSRTKLAEVAQSFPNKPIYLVGWGSGSIVAATISQNQYQQQKSHGSTLNDDNNKDKDDGSNNNENATGENTTTSSTTTTTTSVAPVPIAGVICLAFPLFGVHGSRSDIDDPLFGLSHPSLFIIGDRATNVNVTDLEVFRSKLKCENALSVICHADDFLRISNYHQRRLLVTQSYVDKCIIDEITWFITNLPLLQEELKVQAAKAKEEKLAAANPGLQTSAPSFDLNNSGFSTTPKNSSSHPSKNYNRHSKPYRPPTTSNTNPNNNINIEHILNNHHHSTSIPSTPITSSINILSNSNNNNNNNSNSHSSSNNSVQIDGSSTSGSSNNIVMHKDVNSTNHSNITASKLLKISGLGKRRIQDSLSHPHPVGLRKPSIGISPLALPLPSKVPKESNATNPFTWPAGSKEIGEEVNVITDDKMGSSNLLPGQPTHSSSSSLASTSACSTNHNPNQNSSTGSIRDDNSSSSSSSSFTGGIPTIISSRQKALLTNMDEKSQQQQPHHTPQILKQAITQGSKASLSQQQMYNSGTGSVGSISNMIASGNTNPNMNTNVSVSNNNISSSSNSSTFNLNASQNFIPNLPDTTAVVYTKPSNTDILRRFDEQQKKEQDLLNRQALLEAQQKLKQQQRMQAMNINMNMNMNRTSINNIGGGGSNNNNNNTLDNPNKLPSSSQHLHSTLYRLLTPGGPPRGSTQHTAFHYANTNTNTNSSSNSNTNTLAMGPGARALPTRCTDESLSIINSNDPTPAPSSSSSSSGNHNPVNINPSSSHYNNPSLSHHSYGLSNPELFQTLKSTLSVGNNKDVKMYVTGPPPPQSTSQHQYQQQQQQQQNQNSGSDSNRQVLIRVQKLSESLNSGMLPLSSAATSTSMISSSSSSSSVSLPGERTHHLTFITTQPSSSFSSGQPVTVPVSRQMSTSSTFVSLSGISSPVSSGTINTVDAPTTATTTRDVSISKYSVFAEKDRRSLQKSGTNNNNSSVNTSDSNNLQISVPGPTPATTSSLAPPLPPPYVYQSIATTMSSSGTLPLSSIPQLPPKGAIAVILKSSLPPTAMATTTSSVSGDSSSTPLPFIIKTSTAGTHPNSSHGGLFTPGDGSSKSQQQIILLKPLDPSMLDPEKLSAIQSSSAISGVSGLNIISSDFPIMSASSSSSSVSSQNSIPTVYNPNNLSKSKIVVNTSSSSSLSNSNSNNKSAGKTPEQSVSNTFQIPQSTTTTTTVREENSGDTSINEETTTSTTTTTAAVTSSDLSSPPLEVNQEPPPEEKASPVKITPASVDETRKLDTEPSKQQQQQPSNVTQNEEPKAEEKSISEKVDDKVEHNKSTIIKPESVPLVSDNSSIPPNDNGNSNALDEQKNIPVVKSESVLLESKSVSLKNLKRPRLEDVDKDSVSSSNRPPVEKGEKEETDASNSSKQQQQESDGEDDSESEEDEVKETSVPRKTRKRRKFPSVPERRTPRNIKNPPLYSETQLRSANKFQIVPVAEKRPPGRPRLSQVPQQQQQHGEEKEKTKDKNDSQSLKVQTSVSISTSTSSTSTLSSSSSFSSFSSSATVKTGRDEMDRHKPAARYEQQQEIYKLRANKSIQNQQSSSSRSYLSSSSSVSSFNLSSSTTTTTSITSTSSLSDSSSKSNSTLLSSSTLTLNQSQSQSKIVIIEKGENLEKPTTRARTSSNCSSRSTKSSSSVSSPCINKNSGSSSGSASASSGVKKKEGHKDKDIELIEIESDEDPEGTGRMTRSRARYGRPSSVSKNTSRPSSSASSSSTAGKEDKDNDHESEEDAVEEEEAEADNGEQVKRMTRSRHMMSNMQEKEKEKGDGVKKTKHKEKEQQNKPKLTHEGTDQPDSEDSGDEEVEEEGEEDEEEVEAEAEEGEESSSSENPPKKRRRRRLYPVTPATLSSTRTRKVSIPKFYGNNIFT